MFEVVLTTIETKLQRVENLDRAIHHLMRKMDMMERKLASKDAEILAAVLTLEKETHEAHVSVKLNQLSAKLDTLCHDHPINELNRPEDPASASADILVAQPSNRKSSVLQPEMNDKMEDVKEVINGIDRRLGVHINIVSENLGKMSNMVEEVRNVLIDEDDQEDSYQLQEHHQKVQNQHPRNSKLRSLKNNHNATYWPITDNNGTNATLRSFNSHQLRRRKSKFDALLTTLHPLLGVSDLIRLNGLWMINKCRYFFVLKL